jgi:hypothetical protein
LSNTKYKPEGSINAEAAAEYTITYLSIGQVGYKIGDASLENLNTRPKFESIVKTSGTLLISICETLRNVENKGS